MADVPKSWKVAPPPAWKLCTPEELVNTVDQKQYTLGLEKGWLGTASDVEIKEGMHCYAGLPKNLNAVGMPNARDWSVLDDDWK